jgi:hypothetical protein
VEEGVEKTEAKSTNAKPPDNTKKLYTIILRQGFSIGYNFHRPTEVACSFMLKKNYSTCNFVAAAKLHTTENP